MRSVPNKAILSWLWVLSLLSIHCVTNKKIKQGIVEASDKSKISYIEVGQGDTTLFFIHGWCINKEYWSNQFDHFSSRYKIVAIDLPGFGASSKTRPDWSFEQYAEDVKTCIDHLKLKHVILVGHSMSGDIILKTENIASASLVGIIGIDNLHEPKGLMDSVSLAQTASYYDQMEKDFQFTVMKDAKANLFKDFTPPAVVSRVIADISATNPTLAVDVLRSLTTISQTEKKMMQNLKHTLCLVNSDVYPVQMDSLHKYCARGIKVYTVNATGHYPMIEKPEAFNLALQKAIWKQ